MTDEQIKTMLQWHRYLIHKEIHQALYQIKENKDAANLQNKLNDEEWDKFENWLRMIRDD